MTTWIIEARDPLIVRDGRPFGAIPGARAASYSFPFPSTTTGGVRTRFGLGNDRDFDDESQKAELIAEVKRIAVRGPLLVELDDDTDAITDWFAPAPADALLLNLDPPERDRAVLRQLAPRDLAEAVTTNLPNGLLPVCLTTGDKGKPCDNAPRYWRWKKFEHWLLDPAALTNEAMVLSALGHDGPAHEARTHVSVQPGTWTAAEGALFQTRGLEFTHHEPRRERSAARRLLSMTNRLALAVVTDASGIKPGLAPLGGERRIVHWRESEPDSAKLPECPPALVERISKTGACRLVLLTPAHFTEGFRPQSQTISHAGVTPQLKAVASARPQVVSGWDFEIKKPKPTRRLVPMGAVFFLKLDGDEEARREWVEQIWMQCISDNEQVRRDGFGLAVLGAWSGECPTFEVTK